MAALRSVTGLSGAWARFPGKPGMTCFMLLRVANLPGCPERCGRSVRGSGGTGSPGSVRRYAPVDAGPVARLRIGRRRVRRCGSQIPSHNAGIVFSLFQENYKCEGIAFRCGNKARHNKKGAAKSPLFFGNPEKTKVENLHGEKKQELKEYIFGIIPFRLAAALHQFLRVAPQPATRAPSALGRWAPGRI